MSTLVCRLCLSTFVSLRAWEAHMLAHQRLAVVDEAIYGVRISDTTGKRIDPRDVKA